MPLFISPTRRTSIEWKKQWNTEWKAVRDRFFLGTIQREATRSGGNGNNDLRQTRPNPKHKVSLGQFKGCGILKAAIGTSNLKCTPVPN